MFILTESGKCHICDFPIYEHPRIKTQWVIKVHLLYGYVYANLLNIQDLRIQTNSCRQSLKHKWFLVTGSLLTYCLSPLVGVCVSRGNVTHFPIQPVRSQETQFLSDIVIGLGINKWNQELLSTFAAP